MRAIAGIPFLMPTGEYARASLPRCMWPYEPVDTVVHTSAGTWTVRERGWVPPGVVIVVPDETAGDWNVRRWVTLGEAMSKAMQRDIDAETK